MIVKQIWTANAYRNFNYLIACSETGEALAIDPLDHEKCLKAAKEEGWEITQIMETCPGTGVYGASPRNSRTTSSWRALSRMNSGRWSITTSWPSRSSDSARCSA